jgi:membrane protease YdiL (CAAX protease family)
MLLGIAVVVVYLAVLVGLQKASGVPYSDIASSEPNLRKGVLIPVAICTAILVVGLAATGRLANAFTYVPTIAAAWLWVIPAVIAVGIVIRLVRNDWSAVSARFVVVALLATFLVGLSEELLIRGYFVDVLQGSGLSVLWVAVVSSVVFGALHGANILNGQDVKTTLQQVVGSALVGLALFASLALTGSLWLPIALHFLFDFSLIVGGSVKQDGDQASPVEAVLVLAMYVTALASLIAFALA